MVRRFSLLTLAAGLAVTSAVGCRLCDRDNRSNAAPQSPCRLTGSGRPAEACYDPVTGYPVSGGGVVIGPTTVIPGGSYPVSPGGVPRADELPFPTPSDMIPRPGVPFAPPTPAPGDGLGAAPKAGGVAQPVKKQ